MKVKALKSKTVSTETTGNSVEIVMVLDETGSMERNKKATVDSVNEFIISQKKVEGSCNLTLYTFSDYVNYTSDGENTPIRKIIESKDISEVELISEDSYDPYGMTNLYDAIGVAIKETEKNNKSKNVLVVIITDGEENSSKEYNIDTIKEMISKKQKDGWTFVYLGANQDAWSVGSKMGLSANQTMTYDVNNINNMMDTLSTSTAVYRSVVVASSNGSVGNYTDFFGNIKNEKE